MIPRHYFEEELGNYLWWPGQCYYTFKHVIWSLSSCFSGLLPYPNHSEPAALFISLFIIYLLVYLPPAVCIGCKSVWDIVKTYFYSRIKGVSLQPIVFQLLNPGIILPMWN